MAKSAGGILEEFGGGICAFCGSSALADVIDFGNVAVAGAFLTKNEIPNENKYPLKVVFCKDCFAVQVRDHIDPEVLFKTDFYFSSAIQTLRDHFADYAAEVVKRFLPNPKDAVAIEIGSNDGVLLKPLADQGVGKVIGVEPAKNIIETIKDDRLTLINNFFNVAQAEEIIKEHGRVDLLMGNNVYAHISDINGTTEAIEEVLKDDGVFVFEVHYLGKIIEELQYDFIYHEHIYYYSLLALDNHLARHGMVIFDIKPIPIHGGSIRYYAAKKNSKHAKNVSKAVVDLRAQEKQSGYDKEETYKQFAKRVAGKKDELMTLLTKLKKEGKRVVGYGASGRANTIIQYCGITSEHIDYMIDDAPAKLGMFTPGSHLEIKNSEVLKTDKPDYILVFAWAFYNEIAKKNQQYLKDGGQMIVPLPDVKITSEFKE
jgi:methylation protein EvaC